MPSMLLQVVICQVESLNFFAKRKVKEVEAPKTTYYSLMSCDCLGCWCQNSNENRPPFSQGGAHRFSRDASRILSAVGLVSDTACNHPKPRFASTPSFVPALPSS
jgi:hypothetical protein